MCGFNGVYFKDKRNINIEVFNALRDTLKERGPDGKGTYKDEKVLLGHRRLSIIDLESGSQPMSDVTGNIIIIFNGEIYNFIEIRNELKENGVLFSTSSDTEVIIEAYKFWGLKVCLSKLEGMFSFALWDKSKEKLFLTRDRYGEKPLFYFQDHDKICFGSELKSILPLLENKEICKKALNLYLSLTYIPAPLTIYKNIYKLEAGNYLEIANNEIKQFTYYNALEEFKKEKSNQIQSYEIAKNTLKKLLYNSVQHRMISDVPLGAFLSGGIDSSIISAIMAEISNEPINTFSIGFKEKEYDESDRAKLVANHIKSNHTSHILDHNDLISIVDETLSYFDEPFGDSSAIPSMMVAKLAKEKVTVVLTGDCADELFGGYEKYLASHYSHKYQNLPTLLRKPFESLINKIPHTNYTNQKLRKIKKVIKSSKLSDKMRYNHLCSLGFSMEEKRRLLLYKNNLNVNPIIESHFENMVGDELSKTFYSDLKLVLEGDMLTKVDRACMINSLEARVPFLDSSIVHFSAKIPHKFKIENTNKKKILKETFADLLPEETMSFNKKGFGLPLRNWFQNELKDELLDLLTKEEIEKKGFFSYDFIEKILDEHFTNKENHSSKLWVLFVFHKWLAKNPELC